MKKQILLLLSLILAFCVVSCGSDKEKAAPPTPDQTINQPKQAMAQPQEYIDDHPLNYDIQSYGRYDLMILEPIESFHRFNGRMPSTLDEFFNSDFCLVRAKEKETGLLFQEAKALDMNHPEYLVYKFIDDDTAQLSFLLKTRDGQPYINTYQWNRKKFWGFFPRKADGSDADEWAKREKTKPPQTTKKAKEMLECLSGMFGWAVNDYFIDHHSFPANFDELFKEKWGEFRHEPWKHFEYDDPGRKLPNKIFGFDKTKNVFYMDSLCENMEFEHAMEVPANFIEEEGKPLDMREVTDYKSLNITFFADAESLKNAYK